MEQMPRPLAPTTSRHARHAIGHLGRLIRAARLSRKETAAQLAERAGISRGLLRRIETGDPGCSIGAVFETATLVGIPLFDLDPAQLAAADKALTHTLALLPRAARPSTEADDDF